MWVVYKNKYTPVGFNLSNFPTGTPLSNTINLIPSQEVLTITRDINLWAAKQLSSLKTDDPAQSYIFTPFTHLDQTGTMKGFLYPSTLTRVVAPGPLFTCKWVNES